VPKVVGLSAAERARYVGRYEVRGPGGAPAPTQVFERADTLVLNVTGMGVFSLMPYGAHTFGLGVEHAHRVTFSVAPDGRVSGLTLNAFGQQFPGRRLP